MNPPRYARQLGQYLMGWANKHDPNIVAIVRIGQRGEPPLCFDAAHFGEHAARIIVAEDARLAAKRAHPSSGEAVLTPEQRVESERLLRRALGE